MSTVDGRRPLRIIRQGIYENDVRRLSDTESVANSFLLTTDFEGSIALTIKNDTFEIVDAQWSIHRAPDMDRRGEGRAEMLIGDSAFTGDRRNHVKVLPDYSAGQTETPEDPKAVSPEWAHIRELYLEAMRGLLQAENYLLYERGFKGIIDYEESWDSDCRPYHTEKPGVNEWPAYVGSFEHFRKRDLYNKYLQMTLMDNGDRTVTALGTYNDSFHEMSVCFVFDPADGIIQDLSLNHVRVPFKPCHDFQESFAERFIGLNIHDLSKREVGKLIGGSFGCFHFVDIIYDLVEMAAEL
ncbi:MAG: DUF2889 domain-containing protein [Anaerovoracaceae bacterium]